MRLNEKQYTIPKTFFRQHIKTHFCQSAMQVESKAIDAQSQFMTAKERERVRAEGQRRAQATTTGGNSTLEDGGECNIPFKRASQAYALINMSNVHQRPQSSAPAFRVLGLFDSVESVHSHIALLHDADPNTQYCNMSMITTHGFYSIPTSTDFSMHDKLEKVNTNLQVYHQQLEALTREFTKHHDALTTGKHSVSDPNRNNVHDAQQRINRNKARVAQEETEEQEGASECKEEAPTDTAHPAVYTQPPLPYTPPPLPCNSENHPVNAILRSCEVRGQNFVSVMVLRDYMENDTEPAFNLLGAFATEEECVRYNKYVAAKHIDKFDIYTKAMYEWVFPNMLFDTTTTNRIDHLYRNEELDRIMQAHRDNQAKVNQFETYFENNEMDIPAKDIEPDLSEPAARIYKPPMGCGF